MRPVGRRGGQQSHGAHPIESHGQPNEVDHKKDEFGCREIVLHVGIKEVRKRLLDGKYIRQGIHNGTRDGVDGEDIQLTSRHVHHKGVHQNLLSRFHGNSHCHLRFFGGQLILFGLRKSGCLGGRGDIARAEHLVLFLQPRFHARWRRRLSDQVRAFMFGFESQVNRVLGTAYSGEKKRKGSREEDGDHVSDGETRCSCTVRRRRSFRKKPQLNHELTPSAFCGGLQKEKKALDRWQG